MTLITAEVRLQIAQTWLYVLSKANTQLKNQLEFGVAKDDIGLTCIGQLLGYNIIGQTLKCLATNSCLSSLPILGIYMNVRKKPSDQYNTSTAHTAQVL